MIGELVMRLFHARTNAHVLHLGTTSYAKHKALNEFYDGITDFADSIAEMVQDEKLLVMPSVRYAPVDDPVKLVAGLRDWLRENRYDAVSPEETEVQNVIDEAIGLCRSTLYKLKFLK